MRYVHDLKIKDRAVGCYHMRKVNAESLADFIYNKKRVSALTGQSMLDSAMTGPV